MAVSSTTTEVPTPDGPMPAHLWWPGNATGPVPGLVVFQEIFGVSSYIRSRCQDLAHLGYAVLAPEVYWRLGSPEIDETAPDFLEQAIGLAGQVDWATAVADGVHALEHLRSRPDVGRVGLVGFCFGGGLAFDVAAAGDPSLLVSYYGSALPGLLDRAPGVTCPSLHHFGTADSYVPLDTVERIRDAVTAGGSREQVEFHLHEGAGHAFDNPHPAFHHPVAAGEAWEQTVAFLRRHLPPA
jgi:carboxymethylenebutenolidase